MRRLLFGQVAAVLVVVIVSYRILLKYSWHSALLSGPFESVSGAPRSDALLNEALQSSLDAKVLLPKLSGFEEFYLWKENPAFLKPLIQAETLLAQPVLSYHEASLQSNASIPKLIHQYRPQEKLDRQAKVYHEMWHAPSVYSRFLFNHWRFYHPEYQIVFWTDEELTELANQHWPGLNTILQAQEGLKFQSCIEVLLKYVVLYHYGGLWADYNTMPLTTWQPMLSALPEIARSLQKEGDYQQWLVWSDRGIVAASPLLDFWPKVLNQVVGAINSTRDQEALQAKTDSVIDVLLRNSTAFDDTHSNLHSFALPAATPIKYTTRFTSTYMHVFWLPDSAVAMPPPVEDVARATEEEQMRELQLCKLHLPRFDAQLCREETMGDRMKDALATAYIP
jgi:mannosyltransferase OCH1-like enzyme